MNSISFITDYIRQMNVLHFVFHRTGSICKEDNSKTNTVWTVCGRPGRWYWKVKQHRFCPEGKSTPGYSLYSDVKRKRIFLTCHLI